MARNKIEHNKNLGSFMEYTGYRTAPVCYPCVYMYVYFTEYGHYVVLTENQKPFTNC